MEVKIIRSPKRKKTVQAKLVAETLIIYLPLGLPSEEENRLIQKMKEKIEKKKLKEKLDKDSYLKDRSKYFNRKYFQGKLKVNSIEFVTNLKRRSGSCTPSKGTIRISHELMDMPRWVLDYVIIHEMTHLLFPNHSKEFWEKVNEYKYAERAKGYLICKGMEKDEVEKD